MDASTWRWGTVMIFSVIFLRIVGARPLEDEEIEVHLNSLNKPAVKSIELEGEVFDCVDIYKQPAFDHPLLKDHKIIMSPSFLKKTDKSAERSLQQPILQPALPNSEGCPEGTVPIRRVQKSDLLRASSLKAFGRRDATRGQVERAGQTLFHGPYIGAKGGFNVWGVSVEPNEWSHAAIEVSDGEDRDDNKIILEAGWLVNPTLFGDNRPRYYGYWTTDGYKNTGCYNNLCPGFVQTSGKYPFGMLILPLSEYAGDQFGIGVTIYMDAEDSVWWVMFHGFVVGYWPMSLFKNGSFESASTVRWVGSVLNTNKGGQHTTTQMGSGHFPDEGWGRAAYTYDVQVMKDENDGFYQPSPMLMTFFADNALCYDFKHDDYAVYFGGPGRGRLCH